MHAQGQWISSRPWAHLWWLEDDRALCRLLADRLRACGWQLTLFHQVKGLRKALQHEQPDLLLLDRLMPGVDAVTLLQQLRVEGYHFPVLVLSALGLPEQRIEGLALGANDYLSKPFRFKELIWRIERLLQTLPPRLLLPRGQPPLTVGPLTLTLEPQAGRLQTATGAGAALSRGDTALLLALLEDPGAVLSREALAWVTGSQVDVASSRSLDVRLSRLRRRLRQLSDGAVSIEAVRGQGYRLTLPQAGAAAALLPLGQAQPLVWLLLGAGLVWGLWRAWRWLRCRGARSGRGPHSQLRARVMALVHDQRAPLTRLWLRLEELEPDQAPGQEQLEALVHDLELLRLLQLQLAQVAWEPATTARPQPVDLHRLCRRVVRHYRPGLVKLAVPALTLQLEPDLLQRVLHNLVDNALEHGNPPVLISARAAPSGVAIEVQDRGQGRAVVPGTGANGLSQRGLGLALALSFCRRHGGRLELVPTRFGGLLVRLQLETNGSDTSAT